MKRILVIDDDIFVRQNVAQILSFEGFDVVEASNGLIGVEQARERHPHLILCDVSMDPVDGYEVLRQLKQDTATAAIPFIFVTARAERTETRYGMSLGADDYLTKPFTVPELLNSIYARLEKQEIVDSLSEQKLDNLRQSIALALPHELRTPLSMILGFSEVLITDAQRMDTTDVVEISRNINKSAQRLHRLIENYLIYTRMELFSTRPERFKHMRADRCTNPGMMIEYRAVTKAQQVRRSDDLRLAVQDVESIISSEDLLAKVVDELLDNAFKFSDVGTPVEVRAYQERPYYEIVITDQGRGMTEEQIEGIGAYMQFERQFYEHGGTGLGLAIAKKLAEVYGGQLSVQSTPGKQTRVRVALLLP